MEGTICIGSWIGRLGLGLAPRELEATLFAASDMTAKEIAREMGIAHGTVSKRLDDARFKMGSRSVRGLVMEAFKRGIIAPAMCMVLALLVGLEENPNSLRRPSAPRRFESFTSVRRIEAAQVS